MPRETRAQRLRQRQENEDSAQSDQPQGPGRSALPRSAQAQQAARYRAGRPPTRVRFNLPQEASGNLSEGIRRAQSRYRRDGGGAEVVLPSIEVDESSAAEEAWTPSLVIGSSLGDDLSAIQLADRKVVQWRAILKHHQDKFPEAVSPIQEMLDEAIAERSQLDDTEANRKPKSALPSTAREAINDRLNLLRSALAESTFPPEAANIRAAIAGYTRGLIPYSPAYTLIYAGHIVDTCPSYESFSSGPGRATRLDRFAAVHGAGWLWYEPPLTGSGGGGGRETVKRACALTNPPSRRAVANGGHWQISMGFRRRVAWVSRGVAGADAEAPVARPRARKARKADGSHDDDYVGEDDDKAAKKRRRSSGASGKSDVRMVQDPTAPTIYFSMHLDSGASKPTLYEADFRAIGISPSRYSAQSVVWAQGVFGKVKLKMFEIDVGIYGDNSTSLVSPSPPDRVWPAEPDALGATLPVMMMPGRPPHASYSPADGNRLSGMLPFYAAYMSAVPGTHTIWLGEDRRDVLGAARMPGQVRYHGFDTNTDGGGSSKTAAAAGAGHPTWLARDLGAADRIVFEHDVEGEPGTWVRDEDTGMGASVITLNKKGAPPGGGASAGGGNRSEAGASAAKQTWRIEPRKQAKQAKAFKSATKRARAEEELADEGGKSGPYLEVPRVKRRMSSRT